MSFLIQHYETTIDYCVESKEKQISSQTLHEDITLILLPSFSYKNLSSSKDCYERKVYDISTKDKERIMKRDAVNHDLLNYIL